MKTTEENGKGLTNKSGASLGKKEEDKTLGRSSGEVSNKSEGVEGLNKDKPLGEGLTLDKKRMEGGEAGKEGGITGESKSIHVEDWENDPFIGNKEDNVRAELDLRKNKNLGNNSKGVENTDTGGEGRSMGSGPDSKKYNREDESGESGV